MLIGEIILKCNNVSGSVSNVTALDEGDSYIYRDARPIVGSSSSGFGGDTRWVITTDDPWTASTLYAVGDWVGPTVANDRSYRCKTAGTSGVAEPSPWGTTIGADTADGATLWTCYYTGIIVNPIDGITDLDVHVKPTGNGVVYLG